MATPKLALIPTGYKAGKLYSVLPESGVGDFTVVRATEATRVNEEGLIETMGANVPRLDYSGGGCPVLLTEPQRTNLITYSEDFSNAYWTKAGSSVVSGFTSPDGASNAYKLVEDTSTGGHNFRKNSLAVTLTNTYTFSIIAKKGERDWIMLRDDLHAGVSTTYFDLTNGVVGTTNSAYSNIEALGDGFYRCSTSTISTHASSTIYPATHLAEADNDVTYTGDGTSGVYIFGAQLEEASYPTSYIKTEGSAVTRNGDQVTGAGDAATFNDSEGVLMMEIEIPNKSTTDSYPIAIFGTGATLQIYYRASSQSISFLSSVGGIQYLFHSTINPLGNHKLSLVYKQGQYSAFIDGFLMNRQNSGNVPSNGTLNTLSIKDSGSSNFYGRVKQVQYFNTVLTDSELETLTSWTSFIEMAQAQQYNII